MASVGIASERVWARCRDRASATRTRGRIHGHLGWARRRAFSRSHPRIRQHVGDGIRLQPLSRRASVIDRLGLECPALGAEIQLSRLILEIDNLTWCQNGAIHDAVIEVPDAIWNR